MDIIIRFFDSVYNEVKILYLDLRATGLSSHRDLFEQYSSVIFKLDLKKYFKYQLMVLAYV